MSSQCFCVYILASSTYGTLYIGITGDLPTRLRQHKNGGCGFTKKYKINKLVYYEIHDNPYNAIVREKQLKAWKRKWKVELINKENPYWKDLGFEFEER